MIDQNMREIIIALVDKELDNAVRTHGKCNSPHEGYSLIKEEIEEAQDEMNLMDLSLQALWRRVKDDKLFYKDADDICSFAINCACECVQVAAMAKKSRSI